jgi:hypothetical protein
MSAIPAKSMANPLLAAALAGCVAGQGPPPSPARPALAAVARSAATPRSRIVVVPEVMPAQGLAGVIGAPATALIRRFGAPRLDLAEGDARKLQFAGRGCVLDIFLYPLAIDAPLTATHVEARLRRGGATTDPGACIREIEKR